MPEPHACAVCRSTTTLSHEKRFDGRVPSHWVTCYACKRSWMVTQCDESEGCGRTTPASDVCRCPECDSTFCGDCWSEPDVHTACKQADADRTERYIEDTAGEPD